MSVKTFSLVGEHCSVTRNGDKLIFSTRDAYQGLKLSDNKMRDLFYLYCALLENERLEELQKAREQNDD